MTTDNRQQTFNPKNKTLNPKQFLAYSLAYLYLCTRIQYDTLKR